MMSTLSWIAALRSSVEVHYTSEECRWTSTGVHDDVTVQKIVFFVVTVVRTTNPRALTHVWTFMGVGY
jgi:hypothetical protein